MLQRDVPLCCRLRKFYKDDANKEQLHSKIQFWASSDLNNPTPNAILKLLTEKQCLIA